MTPLRVHLQQPINANPQIRVELQQPINANPQVRVDPQQSVSTHSLQQNNQVQQVNVLPQQNSSSNIDDARHEAASTDGFTIQPKMEQILSPTSTMPSSLSMNPHAFFKAGSSQTTKNAMTEDPKNTPTSTL